MCSSSLLKCSRFVTAQGVCVTRVGSLLMCQEFAFLTGICDDMQYGVYNSLHCECCVRWGTVLHRQDYAKLIFAVARSCWFNVQCMYPLLGRLYVLVLFSDSPGNDLLTQRYLSMLCLCKSSPNVCLYNSRHVQFLF